MSLTYTRLRQMHFRKSLAERFRGLGRTVLVIAVFLGVYCIFVVEGIVATLANGLILFSNSQTTLTYRFSIIFAWQMVTLWLLWSLRSLIFMTSAESFFSTLPIPKRAIWSADVFIALQCYSFLWVPILVVFYMLWSREPSEMALAASVSYFVMVGVGLMLNIFLLRGEYLRAANMALPLFLLVILHPQTILGCVIMIGASVMTATPIIYTRQRSIAVAKPFTCRHPIYDRLALASSLVLPVSINVLRDTLIGRGIGLLGAFAFSLSLLAGHTHGDSLAKGLFISLVAAASAALYRLPTMIRSTVLDKLNFLAGSRRFRWRVTVFATGLPVTVFVICLAVSWEIANRALPVGVTDHVLPFYAIYFYAALFLLEGLTAILSTREMKWLLPTAHFVVTLVLLTTSLA